MKILFDEAAFNQPYGGVTKYYVELIKHLPKDYKAILSLRTTQNMYLQEEPFSYPKATHTQWNFWPWLKVRGKWKVYRFLAQTLRLIPSCEYENRRLFVRKLKEGDYDIVHITDPHKYTFEWTRILGKRPVVMTIADLIPDMNPQAKRLRRDRAKALKLVDHIIAVSEYTKQDIVRIYGVAPEKISVVHLGFDPVKGTPDKSLFPGMRYLLYVGARRGYKNFSFFAVVAAKLLKEDPTLHLVCTGSKLAQAELQPFVDAGVAEKVHSFFVNDCDFPALYAHAQAFIYPSRYEGFGIPILDAFNNGCPVILSRCSCFPEVGGEAALYFDDGDAEGLSAQVKRVLGDDALRAQMVAAGKERAEFFNWQRCADETVKVYDGTMQGFVA